MKLTLAEIKRKRELDKPLKLSAGHGLFLLIQPNGKKYWRYSYRFEGKQKTLALGVFPEVGIDEAEELFIEARALLKKTKVDPAEHRKALKQSQTSQEMDSFEVVAREWFANQSPIWVPSHADKIIRRLERDIFPWLGASPIASITAQQLLIAARRIEERGVKETARQSVVKLQPSISICDSNWQSRTRSCA